MTPSTTVLSEDCVNSMGRFMPEPAFNFTRRYINPSMMGKHGPVVARVSQTIWFL